MSLATICRLIGPKINDIYKFGGYLSRGAATIDDYKIKWTRPPRILISDPQQSGDMGLDISVKPTEIKLYYQNSKELENANDIVKKMFSVKFQPHKEFKNLKREKIIALVKRHMSDRGSVEVKIAAMTSEIHDLQKYIQEHPRNKKANVLLKELIEKRKRFLRLLRSWDYRRFEWILERLNLVYKPEPVKMGMVSRKESLRRITQNYCDDIIQKKLKLYKAELKEQQKAFYLEKAEKLEFILKEEKECGITPTVTEEDIEAARKKAQELIEQEM
ncbi:28S ribosomal protein S15, mitochondrial [Anthophora plagiata]